jgi:tetratricopeptide (TPR) repeat protein
MARAEADAGPVPKLREGIDITKLRLSLEEGFVASRIDGRTSIGDIAHLVGKPRPETEKIVEKLAKAGIVQLEGTVESRSRRPALADKNDGPTATDYGAYVFPAALMDEPGELSEPERKRVIWFYEHLERWSHYELLQVKRRDDEKALKRAYFERSKEWHPDRFRRGQLGAFKRMIEEIYHAVKEAYDVLTDEDLREAYDETCIFAPDEEDLARMLDAQRRADRDRLREQELIERRKRRNPMRKRIDKAKALFEEALQKESAGDLLNALRVAQTAAMFDPRPAHLEAVERLKVTAGEQRIGPYLRRGQHHESMLDWDEAVEVFDEAVRIAPENGPMRLRLAYNMMMAGRDAQEANTHAQKAVTLLPDDPEAHFVLGLCYEKGGMEKAAVRAYSRALELKPNYLEAKKKLKKLKWGFLGG